jgi:hypothetical protein
LVSQDSGRVAAAAAAAAVGYFGLPQESTF